MPAYKDKAKGTWYASFYYEDWTGKKVKKMKRGFPTKREAGSGHSCNNRPPTWK